MSRALAQVPEDDDSEGVIGQSVASLLDSAEKVDPEEAPASAFPPAADRPCWRVYDDWVGVGEGKLCRPGTYWHGKKESKDPDEPPELSDTWCWGPLHLQALTRDGAGTAFGVLLRFVDRDRH